MTGNYPALNTGFSLMVREYRKGVVPKVVTDITAVPLAESEVFRKA
jgi:hypothetical protein